MNAQTRELPCTPVVDGVPTMIAFTGENVGPFFIHRGYQQSGCLRLRGDWTITHAATGFSVVAGVKTKVRAFRAARKLANLKCWNFTEPEQARAIPNDVLRLIREIRGMA